MDGFVFVQIHIVVVNWIYYFVKRNIDFLKNNIDMFDWNIYYLCVVRAQLSLCKELMVEVLYHINGLARDW